VSTPDIYKDRLLAELRRIEEQFVSVIAASTINYTNLNRAGSGIVFMGAADFGWGPSDDDLTVRRMSLLAQLRDWAPRYRLLFPHPTPQVASKLEGRIGHLESWLTRKRTSEHSIPQTTAAAVHVVQADIKELAGLAALLRDDPWGSRVVVDTNVLIDNPDITAFLKGLPDGYLVHLLPVVLRELDELKRSGRTSELREAAQRANRRLKGIRSNGGVGEIKVQGSVSLVFEHIEPRSGALPDWLDLTVPDDRFIASTLLIQSIHPGSAVYAATSDINLQTKLAAVGLPFLDPEA
jgi:rRNA-processing protein FCF1